LFAYEPPSDLKTTSKASTKGGWLIITGQNLGPDLGETSIHCCDRPIKEIELKQPHKRLRVRIPPGCGRQIPLRILVGGQSVLFHFDYQAPEILKIGTVPLEGGLLEVTGTNFGNEVRKISVFVREVWLKDIAVQIHTPHQKLVLSMPAYCDLHTPPVGPVGAAVVQNQAKHNRNQSLPPRHSGLTSSSSSRADKVPLRITISGQSTQTPTYFAYKGATSSSSATSGTSVSRSGAGEAGKADSKLVSDSNENSTASGTYERERWVTFQI
jgi:hypothetical protein